MENKQYPKHNRLALLTAELRWCGFTLDKVTRHNHTIEVALLAIGHSPETLERLLGE